jgi:hypothetical protein
MIPASIEAFSLDADLDALVPLEQVQCDSAQPGEVLCSMTPAYPPLVFSEANVQLPVQIILH